MVEEHLDARALLVQVLAHQPEEHPVHPVAVPPVRAPASSLADEPGALRVRDRPLVERVDLELETVVAEIAEQVALEHARRVVREPAAPEGRMDREPAERRHATAPVLDFEAHRPRPHPVDLDHEAPEPLRLS